MITLAEAQARCICRICGRGDREPSPHGPGAFRLEFGDEFGHEACLAAIQQLYQDRIFKRTCTDHGRSGLAEEGVKHLLELIGEDPKREGLLETPARVAKAFQEMTAGYGENPERILAKTFTTENDEMVVVRDIAFWSLCEHHLLPFHGKAHVGYVPGLAPDPTGTDPGKPKRRIVGLSKIPRAVQAFARRLQVQENLTQQVALAIEKAVAPAGVGVVIEATHLCAAARGVRSDRSKMVTSCLRGVFRDAAVRAEFMALTRKEGR